MYWAWIVHGLLNRINKYLGEIGRRRRPTGVSEGHLPPPVHRRTQTGFTWALPTGRHNPTLSAVAALAATADYFGKVFCSVVAHE